MAATNRNGIDVIRTATDNEPEHDCDYCGDTSSDVSPNAVADGSFTYACQKTACQMALRTERQAARNRVA